MAKNQKVIRTTPRKAFHRGFVRGTKLASGDRELLNERRKMYANYSPVLTWERPASEQTYETLPVNLNYQG